MTQKEMLAATQAHFMPKLMEYRKREQWEDFIHLSLSVHELLPAAFSYYDEVPDSMKYQFAVDAYIHNGDKIPAVRKAIRTAAQYGKAKLPAEIADREMITIYRAGEETIKKAKFRISWTTNFEIAKFFLNEYINRHAARLYRGTIRTADIIAYCNERDEKEVMQYCKVFNITDITPTGEKISN